MFYWSFTINSAMRRFDLLLPGTDWHWEQDKKRASLPFDGFGCRKERTEWKSAIVPGTCLCDLCVMIHTYCFMWSDLNLQWQIQIRAIWALVGQFRRPLRIFQLKTPFDLWQWGHSSSGKNRDTDLGSGVIFLSKLQTTYAPKLCALSGILHFTLYQTEQLFCTEWPSLG